MALFTQARITTTGRGDSAELRTDSATRGIPALIVSRFHTNHIKRTRGEDSVTEQPRKMRRNCTAAKNRIASGAMPDACPPSAYTKGSWGGNPNEPGSFAGGIRCRAGALGKPPEPGRGILPDLNLFAATEAESAQLPLQRRAGEVEFRYMRTSRGGGRRSPAPVNGRQTYWCQDLRTRMYSSRGTAGVRGSRGERRGGLSRLS